MRLRADQDSRMQGCQEWTVTVFTACLGVSFSRLFPAQIMVTFRVYHPVRVLNLLNQDFCFVYFSVFGINKYFCKQIVLGF